MPTILHITPNLPPAICGVGSYAMMVGQRMIESGVDCRHLALGHQVTDTPLPDRSPVWFWDQVSRQVEHELTDSESAPEVRLVLHYSGYGYSFDGAPAWLADAIAHRPSWATEIRLVTYFHELFVAPRPWRRSFWHSSRQRRVAVAVGRTSDALLTNRSESAAWLEQATGRPAGSVKHLPIPSLVGEPQEIAPYWERPTQAVVFGRAKAKCPFLRGTGAKSTARACLKLGITRLVDIGSPMDFDGRPFDSAGIEVAQLGFLSNHQVSRELLNSRIGFFDYNSSYLAKSSVLAALVAHGTIVIGSDIIAARLLDTVTNEYSVPSMRSILHSSNVSQMHEQMARLSSSLFQSHSARSTAAHAKMCLNAFGESPVALHTVANGS